MGAPEPDELGAARVAAIDLLVDEFRGTFPSSLADSRLRREVAIAAVNSLRENPAVFRALLGDTTQPARDGVPRFSVPPSPNVAKAGEMLADPAGYFDRALRESQAAIAAELRASLGPWRPVPTPPAPPRPLTLLRFITTSASILWALVVAASVLAVTVEPGAINAALGIGVCALISTGFVVTEWIERRRDRKRGRTS